MTQNLRALRRTVAGFAFLPVMLGLAALQGFIVGPLTKNYNAIPNMIYRTLRKIIGLKVEFNASSAPPVKDKPVWFVANHMSIADFAVLGGTLNGTFAGKGDVLKWPVIRQLAQAVKYIGLRRSSEFNPESRAKIIHNFNAGQNTIMFPEGTTTDGKQVGLFRAALPSLLYGELAVDAQGNRPALRQQVVVQPVAIRVKSVNGQDAFGKDGLRNLYSMAEDDNTLRRIWRRMQLKQVVLEVTVFPPLNPADHADAKALMNKAALDIASIVNPGQTTFEKAKIPGKTETIKPAA
jgi:1-acyl-sn-glycerol-3-phosphate acyltransferase